MFLAQIPIISDLPEPARNFFFRALAVLVALILIILMRRLLVLIALSPLKRIVGGHESRERLLEVHHILQPPILAPVGHPATPPGFPDPDNPREAASNASSTPESLALFGIAGPISRFHCPTQDRQSAVLPPKKPPTTFACIPFSIRTSTSAGPPSSRRQSSPICATRWNVPRQPSRPDCPKVFSRFCI